MDGQTAAATIATPRGAGIGLRSQHIHEVILSKPEVPWFEILADNHMAAGGPLPKQLAAVRSSYPITFHCVGMSIAGTDELNWEYLENINRLAHQFEPAWISDHLCFTCFGGHQYHDLLPFPYSEEALDHVSERVMKIQEALDRVLVVENVSSYLLFRQSTMSEGEFLNVLSKRTGCELLVDVNNAYVNQVNHGIDAKEFFSSLPTDSIREIHLAGFEDKGGYLIDAHNNCITEEVLKLYQYLIDICGETPTLIEWDNDIPAFEVLMEEAGRASHIMDRCSEEYSAPVDGMSG